MTPDLPIGLRYLLLVLLAACAWTPVLAGLEEYQRPDSMPVPEDNPLTPAKIALGKALFFDPRLSGNNHMSCATCHDTAHAWSSKALITKQIDGRLVTRSIPTLVNVGYQQHYTWDGRFSSLEQQALDPIRSRHEMHQNLDELPQELAAIAEYPALFARAFPDQDITIDTLAKALASFQRTLVAGEAPFDRWVKGEAQAISTAAQRGFALFEGKANCVACHHGFNFTDNGFHNIGLEPDYDLGRFTLVAVPILTRAFKTPTLRDVSRSAPYMHNGEHRNLQEVIDHYNRGGKMQLGLDPAIRPLSLSASEKQDLIAFLNTLTADANRSGLP